MPKSPAVPHHSNARAVVAWFINHDRHLSDLPLRVGRQGLVEVEQAVLADLEHFADARSLSHRLAELSQFWQDVLLPRVAMAATLESVDSQLIAAESMFAARIRILGFFLQRRFDVDPNDMGGATLRVPDADLRDAASPARPGVVDQEVLRGASEERRGAARHLGDERHSEAERVSERGGSVPRFWQNWWEGGGGYVIAMIALIVVASLAAGQCG